MMIDGLIVRVGEWRRPGPQDGLSSGVWLLTLQQAVLAGGQQLCLSGVPNGAGPPPIRQNTYIINTNLKPCLGYP